MLSWLEATLVHPVSMLTPLSLLPSIWVNQKDWFAFGKSRLIQVPSGIHLKFVFLKLWPLKSLRCFLRRYKQKTQNLKNPTKILFSLWVKTCLTYKWFDHIWSAVLSLLTIFSYGCFMLLCLMKNFASYYLIYISQPCYIRILAYCHQRRLLCLPHWELKQTSILPLRN